jgi:hypothetical protein
VIPPQSRQLRVVWIISKYRGLDRSILGNKEKALYYSYDLLKMCRLWRSCLLGFMTSRESLVLRRSDNDMPFSIIIQK